MIIDLAEWLWDHWQEITLNALLLFILRRFIIKELSQLLRPSQTEAILSNQKVIMRVTGVESEWKSNLPMNGFKITLPQLSKKLYLFSLMDTKHLKIRRKTKMNTNINYATLIPTILGAAKLILQTFGIDIPDATINEIVNGAAAVGTIIGIFMAHRKQVLVPTQAITSDPNKFIQG